jgi:hypothetical protein
MTLRQSGFTSTATRDAYRKGWAGPAGAFDKLAVALRLDAMERELPMR